MAIFHLVILIYDIFSWFVKSYLFADLPQKKGAKKKVVGIPPFTFLSSNKLGLLKLLSFNTLMTNVDRHISCYVPKLLNLQSEIAEIPFQHKYLV